MRRFEVNGTRVAGWYVMVRDSVLKPARRISEIYGTFVDAAHVADWLREREAGYPSNTFTARPGARRQRIKAVGKTK